MTNINTNTNVNVTTINELAKSRNTAFETKVDDFTITTTDKGTKVVTANWTSANIAKACNIINSTLDKADYAKAVICAVVIESVKQDFNGSDKALKKLIKETKELLCNDLHFKETAVVDKYYNVAKTFITLDNDILKGSWKRDDNGHTITDLDIDFNAIHALKDKYGFEFSVTSMQEMLWLKDEDGNVDVEKIIKLIADGKLKASMPACNAKTGIRAVINENKLTTNPVANNGNVTQNATGGSQNATEKETVQFTKTSDKERVTAIQSIINGITDTQFTSNKMVTDFIEYIGEYLKNNK